MATNYPGGLDSFTAPDGSAALGEVVGGRKHSERHRDVEDAVEAIQAELGVNPSGGSATVAARLDGLERLHMFDIRTYGASCDGTTDDSAAVAAAITAANSAGGGIIYFPTGTTKITQQLLLPNDGNLVPSPTQKPFIFRGAGGHYNGQNGAGSGGSRLLLTYQGSGTTNDAKILTRGLGVFRLEDVVLYDTTANSTTPFLFTTLTTLKVENVAFMGQTGTTSCAQDAIILGGTKKYASVPVSGTGYGDPDAPFQGYGTIIRGCYFRNIRRGVYGRSYANQVVIDANFFDKGCGTNIVGGACIEFDSSLTNDHPGDPCAYNVITGNYFEWSGGYYYQVKFINGAGNYIAGNGGEDSSPGGVGVALVGLFKSTILGTDYPSSSNSVIGNMSTSAGIGMYEDAASTGHNLLIGANYGTTEGTKIPGRLTIGGGSLYVPDVTATAFSVQDTTTTTLFSFGGASRQMNLAASLYVDGNSAGAGTTYITLGNNSTASDALITLNAPSAKNNSIQFKRGGSNAWLLYDAASTTLYLRDSVNSKMHVTFTPGAGAGGGTTEFNTGVKVVGNVGFYNAAPAAKPTVSGSRGGNAALASLLTALSGLGLLTDSSTA